MVTRRPFRCAHRAETSVRVCRGVQLGYGLALELGHQVMVCQDLELHSAVVRGKGLIVTGRVVREGPRRALGPNLAWKLMDCQGGADDSVIPRAGVPECRIHCDRDREP